MTSFEVPHEAETVLLAAQTTFKKKYYANWKIRKQNKN